MWVNEWICVCVCMCVYVCVCVCDREREREKEREFMCVYYICSYRSWSQKTPHISPWQWIASPLPISCMRAIISKLFYFITQKLKPMTYGADFVDWFVACCLAKCSAWSDHKSAASFWPYTCRLFNRRIFVIFFSRPLSEFK